MLNFSEIPKGLVLLLRLRFRILNNSKITKGLTVLFLFKLFLCKLNVGKSLKELVLLFKLKLMFLHHINPANSVSEDDTYQRK